MDVEAEAILMGNYARYISCSAVAMYMQVESKCAYTY
jgi:hypothetical protein